MRWASPSTIAVLPTPGSPIRTGLFFVRRESTWIVRRISSSRPITGSSFPASASAVRSRPYFSSAWYVPSGSCDVDALPAAHLLESRRAAHRAARASSASSRCSTETNSSPSCFASSSASSSALRNAARRLRLRVAARDRRQLRADAPRPRREARRSSRPALWTSVRGSSWSSSATVRWSRVSSGLPAGARAPARRRRPPGLDRQLVEIHRSHSSVARSRLRLGR